MSVNARQLTTTFGFATSRENVRSDGNLRFPLLKSAIGIAGDDCSTHRTFVSDFLADGRNQGHPKQREAGKKEKDMQNISDTVDGDSCHLQRSHRVVVLRLWRQEESRIVEANFYKKD